jgi:hypothetical protein
MRKGHDTLAPRLGPVAAIFALLAPAGCAHEAFGWVWANQSTMASYTPDATHQYNSASSSNTVTRSGTGVYEVVFAGLGGLHGGNVQVTARGADAALCKVAGWQTAGQTVTAEVRCFQGLAAADSEFLASYEAVDQAISALAYTHYDPPATPTVTVTPDPARSWNVTGIYTPIHQVLLATPISGFAIEHVTADGTGPEFCGFSVNRVTCWYPSGSPVDTAFSYVKGLGRVDSVRHGAYAVYDIAPGGVYPSFTPSTQHNSFSTTSSITVSRIATGLSAVLIPGAASAGANVLVHVTALDLGGNGGPVYCKPVTWNNASADVIVQVACFRSTTGPGTAFDDGFQVSYIVPS